MERVITDDDAEDTVKLHVTGCYLQEVFDVEAIHFR